MEKTNQCFCDDIFFIAHNKDICQDFTLSNDKLEIPYVILCDGCSSTPRSDVGARIVALSIEKTILNAFEFFSIQPVTLARGYIEEKILQNMRSHSYYFGKDYLDATALFSYVSQDKIMSYIYGDGYIIYKLKNQNKFLIFYRKCDNSYPFFLSYYLDTARLRNFQKQSNVFSFGAYLFDAEKNTLEDIEETIVDLQGTYDDGALEPFISEYSSLKIKSLNYAPLNILYTQKEYIDMVILISDGLNSFSQKHKTNTSISYEPFAFKNILSKLLAFKGTKGKFIKRRVKKFKETCQKEGIYHFDDFSIAGISLS